MSSSRHPLGAYRSITRKSVRFKSVADLIIAAGSPEPSSSSDESSDSEDAGDVLGSSSRGGGNTKKGGVAASIRNRPSSPPLRKPDTTQLPDLTGQIQRESKFPSANGGLADVWNGVWNKGSMRVKVAIKVIRSCSDNSGDREQFNRHLREEFRTWRSLVHENVLPLYGVCSDFGPFSSMVCPWVTNGNLNKYLENRGHTLNIVDRFRILRGVAAGLSYLHSYSIIHGDLTGTNVLINTSGHARLSDYGLSSIHADFQGTSYHTSMLDGAVRWAAPELYYMPDSHEAVDDAHITLSEQSDIYSFASVMLQTLSGRIPYYMIRRDSQVLIELSRGKHPPRPPSSMIMDDYWNFMRMCWAPTPTDRPLIEDVLESIEEEYDLQCSKARPLRDLTGQVKRILSEGHIPFEFVHVWEGLWSGRNVSVKILRSQTNFEQEKEREIKRLLRDLQLWQEIGHKNVVPVYGVVRDFGPIMAMVMPDVGDINLTRYLNQIGNQLSLSTRFMLLYEISAGLCHLHGMSVIHGGLAGSSVFIKDGSACITDYGLVPIMAQFQESAFPNWCGEAVRWADPSIWMCSASASITRQSDIYAFGCIVLQVLTLRIPFAEWPTPVVVNLMRQGKIYHPPRPSTGTNTGPTSEVMMEDGHWNLIQQCWAENPIDRPTVEEVSAHVQWFYARPAPAPIRAVREQPQPQPPPEVRKQKLIRKKRSIVVEDNVVVRLPMASSSISASSSPSSSASSLSSSFGRSRRPIVDDYELSDEEDDRLGAAIRNLRM